jgi:hypothetical protein
LGHSKLSRYKLIIGRNAVRYKLIENLLIAGLVN